MASYKSCTVCGSKAFSDLILCEKCIEENAQKSLDDIVLSDELYCGYCGIRLSKEQMVKHLERFPKGNCNDADT